MQSFSNTSCYTLLRALARPLPPTLRTRAYSTSHPRFQPTLSSASASPPNTKAKASTSTSTSTAQPTHEWTEENATISEEDVLADREAIAAELHSAKVQRQIAAFGDGGWKKADWAD